MPNSFRHFPRLLPIALALCACCHSAQDRAASSEPAFGALKEAAFAALHDLTPNAAPAPRGTLIELAGTAPSRAYLAHPTTPRPGRPALIVVHEWWGLNDHIRHFSDRLADEGYVALAVDLYGGQVATTRAAAAQLYSSVDVPAARSIVRAAHEYLALNENAERTASIGWCFGGHWSLRCAIELPDLDGAVIYYGVPIEDPAQLASIRARVLGIFGTLDEGIPPDLVERFAAALTQAGVKHEFRNYPAEHAFANPSSANYDAVNASAAWGEVRNFLADVLAP